jgi:type IV fimbrial biogenesis protein FimT
MWQCGVSELDAFIVCLPFSHQILPNVGNQLALFAVARYASPMKKQFGGFTLIELMIVVSIVAILVALAVPSFNTMMVKRSVQSAAVSLVTDMRFARSEALRRSVKVSICSLAANSTTTCSGDPAVWVNGWIVFEDSLKTGTAGVRDAGEEIVRVQQALPNIASIQRITTPANTKNVFTYEANGFAKAADETLRVTPTSAASNTRLICISINGRPSVRVEGAAACS